MVTGTEVEELWWPEELRVEESAQRLSVAELVAFQLQQIVDMFFGLVSPPCGVFVQLMTGAIVEEVTITDATVAAEFAVGSEQLRHEALDAAVEVADLGG